jgi:hypothetical protein
MNYTSEQDQLAKIELLLCSDSYKSYTIKMNRITRLELIEKVMNRHV